ncbi:MAG: hypothetical protein AAB426_05700 [Myxococcota bacterium]
MQRCWRKLGLAMAVLGLFLADSARANPYDISLRGLGRPASASLSDPAVQRYRLLSTEVAATMMPKPVQPAETLGMSGFEFSFTNTLTDIHQQAPYWQGQPGSPVLEGVLPSHGARQVPDMLWTPTLHLRKGLPLSSEIGVSATYLSFSEMYMIAAEGKIAIYESFFRWVPALSARAAVGRLFGSSDLDMVTGEADIMTSLPFGIGGMLQATPFAGYGRMFAHVNSAILDETPYSVVDSSSDQHGGDSGSLYNFPTIDWQDNFFPRFFAGLRLNIAMVELSYEADWTIMDFANKQLVSHSFKIGFDV